MMAEMKPPGVLQLLGVANGAEIEPDAAGIGPKRLRAIIRGTESPTLEEVHQIAKLFGISEAIAFARVGAKLSVDDADECPSEPDTSEGLQIVKHFRNIRKASKRRFVIDVAETLADADQSERT